jgi:hypothetical protein
VTAEKDAVRDAILRRILKDETVGLEELSAALFPKEHIAAIRQRQYLGLYPGQSGRDIRDLLQQNLLLCQSIRRVNQILETGTVQIIAPPVPPPAKPPPRRWLRLPWPRRPTGGQTSG